MLRWRLIWSAVIIAPLLALMGLDYCASGPAPGVWLFPLAVIISLLAVAELLDLLNEQPHRPAAWSVYAGTLLVVLASGAPLAWLLAGRPYPTDRPLELLGGPLAGLAGALFLVLIAEMRRYQRPGNSTVSAALAVLIVAYVGLSMSFLMALRILGGNGRGMAALLSLLVVVKFSDAGAYAAGRLLGRHQLAPLLSPGKTIEGAVGGVAAACLASWAVFAWLTPDLTGASPSTAPRWGWLGYGLVLALSGMVGDLSVSLIKRDVGRKDSSCWLPGLGGVLDVLDSVLAAAPAAYLCWAAGLVG